MVSYRLATFNIYGRIYELARISLLSFDLSRYRIGLESILDEINSILSETFDIEATAIYPDDIRSIIEENTEDIPEESIPWWLREAYWVELQSSFLKPLMARELDGGGGGGLIYSGSRDPYIPGLSVAGGGVRVDFERVRAGTVSSRGSFNVTVRSPNYSETVSVPINEYFERVYPNAIVDIDSLVDASRDSVQWAGKTLLWARLPAVTLNTPIENVQTPKSWHGVDPVHLNLINQGGWLSGAYGAEIVVSCPKDTKVTLVFRDINNYTNEQGRSTVSLEKGTHSLVIRGSGFLAPLPSIQMSIYPSEVVKIDRVRLLSLWEVIRSLVGW